MKPTLVLDEHIIDRPKPSKAVERGATVVDGCGSLVCSCWCCCLGLPAMMVRQLNVANIVFQSTFVATPRTETIFDENRLVDNQFILKNSYVIFKPWGCQLLIKHRACSSPT